jgi:hypothetical protein
MFDAGCTGVEALNPVCQAGSLTGTFTSSGIDAVLSGLSQWVASGAEWLLAQIGDVLTATTSIDIGADWFRTHYAVMTELAGVVILPLLLISTLQAIYRQNPGQLIKAFLVQLPLALLLGAAAVQIVVLCLSATDALCTLVAGGTGSAVTSLLATLTKGLAAAVIDPTMASFVLLLVGLMIAVAAFVLWLELLIRAAAVYVAVLFLPLALATLVWPSVSHWCKRLVETLTALILSKFVIVATLSLAAGAVTSGDAGTGDHGAGFASVLGGGALLVLATFIPFTILRLIPVVEAGAMGHLEGVRQRGTSAMTRLPRSAASHALNFATEGAGTAAMMAKGGNLGPASAVVNEVGGLVNPDSQGVLEAETAAAGAGDSGEGEAGIGGRGPKPVLGGGDGGAGAGGDGGEAGGASGSGADSAPAAVGASSSSWSRFWADEEVEYAPWPDQDVQLPRGIAPWEKRHYIGKRMDGTEGRTMKFVPPKDPMADKNAWYGAQRRIRQEMDGDPT